MENGNPEGWGQVLDVTPKFNKFDLGFNPGQQSATPRASSLSTPVNFPVLVLLKKDTSM